jgi:endonuclease/exonuclease/phosphatase family metal-dependent hydrolase
MGIDQANESFYPSRHAAIAALVVAVAASAATLAGLAADPIRDSASSRGSFRVLSWNVSGDSFAKDPAAFNALLRAAQPDILLLDEVDPSAKPSQLRAVLEGLESGTEDPWHIDIGRSGGRQRGAIVSRWPLERVPELSELVAYPNDERRRLHQRMTEADEARAAYTMDHGIPVHGAVVLTGERRLLALTTDLQCCGNGPASWQEDRRQVEAREIRRRIIAALKRTQVDGIVFAGDLNLVAGPLPLIYASGPHPDPHADLIAAELRHLDGTETWTWDGRGTPFPSAKLDVQLYSPHSLALRRGYVLDSADLSATERTRLGLEADAAHGLSSHRPLVAEFDWH